MESQLAMVPDDACGRGHRTRAERAFETALHDHLATTANDIADGMVGAPLRQLGAR
jgi:hypothetical protein